MFDVCGCTDEVGEYTHWQECLWFFPRWLWLHDFRWAYLGSGRVIVENWMRLYVRNAIPLPNTFKFSIEPDLVMLYCSCTCSLVSSACSDEDVRFLLGVKEFLTLVPYSIVIIHWSISNKGVIVLLFLWETVVDWGCGGCWIVAVVLQHVERGMNVVSDDI